MGRRGPHCQSDHIKFLKDNPGKQKLRLERAAEGMPAEPAAMMAPLPLKVTVPDFLTHEREKDIFRRVVEDYLTRRVARAPDLGAYARWASYLHRWIELKETPLGYESVSKHGALLRRHPDFQSMLDLERVMQSLEDRLGLNPVARQNIMRGLSAMPGPIAALFDEQPKDTASDSPLGFLQQRKAELN